MPLTKCLIEFTAENSGQMRTRFVRTKLEPWNKWAIGLLQFRMFGCLEEISFAHIFANKKQTNTYIVILFSLNLGNINISNVTLVGCRAVGFRLFFGHFLCRLQTI